VFSPADGSVALPSYGRITLITGGKRDGFLERIRCPRSVEKHNKMKKKHIL
jgi:hypothetical protein